MTDLGCCVNYCKYNEDNLCCKGKISVGGSHATEPETTFCSSFEERERDSVTNSCKKPDRKIEIRCEAEHCVYNDNHNCTAEHVDVGHSMAQGKTECSTFKNRKQ